jgi:hypothetical protein
MGCVHLHTAVLTYENGIHDDSLLRLVSDIVF